MQFALFLGCTIPARLNQYDASARKIFDKLGIDAVDIRDFNCCGYPLRNYDYKSYILSSARNLALAGKENLNIITLCKCCFGSLKKAMHMLNEDESLRNEINDMLAKEKLKINGTVEVTHLLSVLYHEVGMETLKEKIANPYKNLKIATHYGCHALRPSNIMQFDDPGNPRLFDDLVELTGAESVDWQSRLECCGAPMLGVNDDLSMNIMEKKITDARQGGADYICAACSYCQLQFDKAQKMNLSKGNGKNRMPSILYTQLLGLAMGIDADALQINISELDISGIREYL